MRRFHVGALAPPLLLLLHCAPAAAIRPCGPRRQQACCGDGLCGEGETADNCASDCPGVTTAAQCGEEPHSDTGGYAVVFGINHRTASAQECCDRCQAHAKEPRNQARPCNSWVFCPVRARQHLALLPLLSCPCSPALAQPLARVSPPPRAQLPVCWGLDTGWNHTFGECWLKWQKDPASPLFGQRGAYSEEYRSKHEHVRGGPPSHVPWTGGVIGKVVDHSVRWTTGVEGMASSKGEELTNWRASAAPEPATAHLHVTHSSTVVRPRPVLAAPPPFSLSLSLFRRQAWEEKGAYETRLKARLSKRGRRRGRGAGGAKRDAIEER